MPPNEYTKYQTDLAANISSNLTELANSLPVLHPLFQKIDNLVSELDGEFGIVEISAPLEGAE